MMRKMPVDALKLLLAAAASLVLALPAWAQDAEEEPAATEAPAEASGEAAQPENADEEPAAGEDAAAGAAESTGEEAAGEAAGTAGEEAADAPVVVDVEEGTVIDDQTFEGEDDDFIPSEEIQIDQAIPFPTDI
jgi:hypothetical protein